MMARAPARTRAWGLRRQRARQWQAIKAVLPLTVGTFSWGVVTSIALLKSGLSVAQTLGMTIIVYSGTAQLAALPLMQAGASMALLAVTVALVSLRFVLYSSLIARHFRHIPLPKRLAYGYFSTDSGLAMFWARARDSWPFRDRKGYYIGSNMTVYFSWQIGCLLGLLLAGFLPPSNDYAFVGRLAIAALLVPLMRTMPQWGCALAAIAVAWWGRAWPYNLGMLAGVFIGMAIAVLLKRRGSA